jgi:hypothetical protein
MTYDVPLIAQSTSMSCWAASMAMILSWRDQASYDPSLIAANGCGPSYMPSYNNGLDPNDTYILERNGFEVLAPQCYTVDFINHKLASYGPLWVATWAPGPHIRVVRGLVNSTTYINDPAPVNKGSQYTMEFEKFFGAMEDLGSRELKQRAPVYVAHLKSKTP